MTTFEKMHASVLLGKLVAVDRLILKGHLTRLIFGGAFLRFLNKQGVLLKDFEAYVRASTKRLDAKIVGLAERAGRPVEFLRGAHTAARGNSKEDRARAIAARDGVEEGLVCVLSTLETSMSFGVRGNWKTHKLEVARTKRMCKVYYLYFVHRIFGFMHVRIQSWFPFDIQVYVNGHEYIMRQLDKRGIKYRNHENALIAVDDLDVAQRLATRFASLDWCKHLDQLARLINPMLPVIEQAGFGSYYWSIDQLELSTDLLFKRRSALQKLMPDLFRAGIEDFGAEDALRFLGRKLSPALKQQVTADHKRRPEGCRVKYRVGRNSIKMYDKYSVLRIETTINQPKDFKARRAVETEQGLKWVWKPMNKGVSNMRRFVEVGAGSNDRYLEAQAAVQPARPTAEAVRQLDALTTPTTKAGRRVPRLHPIDPKTNALLAAVLHGEHAIHGFRNKHVNKLLYPDAPIDARHAKRRRARVSRAIATLRGHGLVNKVQGSTLYRITAKGLRLMPAAVRLRTREFAEHLRDDR